MQKKMEQYKCYQCKKVARVKGARIVGKELVCEDCYAELNFKAKKNE